MSHEAPRAVDARLVVPAIAGIRILLRGRDIGLLLTASPSATATAPSSATATSATRRTGGSWRSRGASGA
jgi:hypothetical protein